MSDRALILPTHISSWMTLGGGRTARLTGALAAPGSFAWTANTAVYCPFFVPWPYPVRRAFWVNGSAAGGNSDIGIFTPGGAKIWSAGSTANAGNSVPQYVTVSPDIVLTPGWYFVGYVNDGTTNRVFALAMATASGRLIGLYQQASDLPLTAATFAQYAGVGYPLVGITKTSSGF